MREDLLKELEAEFETRRAINEREENARREKIRNNYPQIETAVEEREELVFGTIRRILDGKTGAGRLKEEMEQLITIIAQKDWEILALTRSDDAIESYLDFLSDPRNRPIITKATPIEDKFKKLKMIFQILT